MSDIYKFMNALQYCSESFERVSELVKHASTVTIKEAMQSFEESYNDSHAPDARESAHNVWSVMNAELSSRGEVYRHPDRSDFGDSSDDDDDL